MKINKNSIDTSRAFLTYMALVGDCPKAAAALDMDPAVLAQLAKDEGWDTKIARVSVMSKSGKPGDWEKSVNRALAWTQSQRLRLVLDKVLAHFDGMTSEEILEAVTSRTSSGASNVSCRFFSDLAASIEKANHLSFIALGDTVAERPDQDTNEGEFSASAMHVAVIQALNNPAMRGLPTKKLLADEQAQATQQSESLSTEGDQNA